MLAAREGEEEEEAWGEGEGLAGEGEDWTEGVGSGDLEARPVLLPLPSNAWWWMLLLC